MMETKTYQIKTYSPEFLEAEMELTKEFEERKNLKQIYRSFMHETQITGVKNYREGGVPNFPFVPTDHFYLFDEKETLVGHIHAFPQAETKRCNISVLVIKEGHEDGAKQLFKALVESVKERGYDTLVRNTAEDHVIELEFLDMFGFEKVRLRNVKSVMPISELKFESNDKFKLVPYEEKYRETIIEDLYLPKGYSRQQLDAQMDALTTARENGTVPSWVVALDGEAVVGQSIAFYARQHVQNLVSFNTVTTNIEDEESIPLINTIYASHLASLPEHITEVDHVLFAQVLNLRPIYEKIGFKYLEIHLYEKSI